MFETTTKLTLRQPRPDRQQALGSVPCVVHTRRALHHHGGFSPALVPPLFEDETLQGAVQHQGLCTVKKKHNEQAQ